jgi:hypothetical protein
MRQQGFKLGGRECLRLTSGGKFAFCWRFSDDRNNRGAEQIFEIIVDVRLLGVAFRRTGSRF